MLAPIAGPSPVGANLRDISNPANRGLYDSIRGARQTARKKEMSGGDPATDGSRDDWRSVFTQCINALGTRSKDLEIATYLIESSIRAEGFAALKDSLAAYRMLVEQYWEALYPPLDEENPAGRVAPLGALNGDGDKEGSLRFGIARAPLTDGNNDRFGLFHHECGLAMETLSPPQQESRRQSGWVSLAMFEDSVRKTPTAFLDNSLQILRQCGEELDKLTAALQSRLGSDAPSLAKIRGAIEACTAIVEKYVKERAVAQEDEVRPAAGGGGGGMIGGSALASGAFRTRDEAFDAISRVADFFRKTEPQSPVIFVLEQAVRWGKMPLPELLAEWVADDMMRGQIYKLVGIRPPPPPPQF